MEYIKFSVKQVVKDKSNLLLFIACAVFSFVMLYSNQSSIGQVNTLARARQDFVEVSNSLSDYYITRDALLKSSILNEKDKQLLELTDLRIADDERYKKIVEEIIRNLNEGNYVEAYEYKIELNESMLCNEHSQWQCADNVLAAQVYINKEIEWYQYLVDNNLEQDGAYYPNLELPIKGVTFLTSINKSILSTFFIIVMCYILSQLFSNSYKNKIDTKSILPTQKYLDLKIALIGILVSFGFIVCVNLFVLMVTAIINGMGSLDHPYYVSDSSELGYGIVSLKEILAQAFGLYLLYIVFIGLFVLVLSKVLKNKYLTFSLSIAFLCLGAYLSTLDSFMNPLVRLLPTSYSNPITVVSGFEYLFGEPVLMTPIYGIISLLCSITILSVILVIMKRQERRKYFQ